MPRWVKVFLVSAAVLALLAVVVLWVSGGEHGPSRHVSGNSTTATIVLAESPQLEDRDR